MSFSIEFNVVLIHKKSAIELSKHSSDLLQLFITREQGMSS